MKGKLKGIPDYGDERTITYFAWIPVSIGDEWRWLEFVTVRQIYRSTYPDYTLDGYWDSVEFV